MATVDVVSVSLTVVEEVVVVLNPSSPSSPGKGTGIGIHL